MTEHGEEKLSRREFIVRAAKTTAAAGAVLRRYRAPAGLGRIDVPVAVVVTTEDEVVPTVDQLALLAALPAGTSRHDLAAGHGAFVEDPDRFVAALDAAVADVLTRAAPR